MLVVAKVVSLLLLLAMIGCGEEKTFSRTTGQAQKTSSQGVKQKSHNHQLDPQSAIGDWRGDSFSGSEYLGVIPIF